MEYLKRVFDTHAMGLPESVIRIYPLVCMHIGAAQCDVRFIEKHVKRIEHDPCGFWVYLGDGGECALKTSKGDVYKQLCSPGIQQDILADLLYPIKAKGLLGVRGNHGNRIDKETGLGFDKTFCLRMGIPYMGVQCMLNLVVNRSSYDLFFHHGVDSGVSMQSKVNRAEHFGKFIDADALFTAHSHIATEIQPSVVMSCDNIAKKVKTHLRKQFICGSAYDSRTGYAADKAYPPILPSWLIVSFDGRIIDGQAVREIKLVEKVESNGQYELDHSYLMDYIDEE